MVSRMGLSLLSAVRAPQTAVSTQQDYEDKVVEVYLKQKAGTHAVQYQVDAPFSPEPALAQVMGDVLLPELSAGLPAATATPVRVQLYHIGYSADTRQQMPAQFLALDNTANARPDWREYWPMRNFLLSHTLEDDVFYGFFSPRFTYKTQLDHEMIRDFAHRHGAEHEVFERLESFFH